MNALVVYILSLIFCPITVGYEQVA